MSDVFVCVTALEVQVRVLDSGTILHTCDSVCMLVHAMCRGCVSELLYEREALRPARLIIPTHTPLAHYLSTALLSGMCL